MRRLLMIGIALTASSAAASPDPAISDLSRALPSGWTLNLHAGALVIQHRDPVHIAGQFSADAPHTGNLYILADRTILPITVALRYRVEPVWSAERHAQARATNARIYAELGALRDRHGIDSPGTAHDPQRLATYQREHAAAVARLVRFPRCTIGSSSLFDSPATYADLNLAVDPPGVMREAYAIVELVKRRCR